MFASSVCTWLTEISSSAPLLFAQASLETAAGDAEDGWSGVTRALTFVGIALVSLVLPYLAGVYIAKAIRMPSHGWKLGLILCTIVCGTVLCVDAVINNKIRLGVDLRGGANLVFAVKSEEAAEGQVTDDPGVSSAKMQSLVQILGRRINPSGTKEIVIRPAGNDQIEVIVPEVSDQEINEVIKQLTTAGVLEFRIVANDQKHPELIELAAEQAGAMFVYEDPDNPGEGPIGKWSKVGRDVPEKKTEVTVTVDGKRITKEILPLKYQPMGSDVFRDAKTKQVINIPPTVDLSDRDPRKPEYKLEKWLMQNGHYNAEKGYNDIEVLMATDDGYNVKGEHLRFVRSSFDDLANPMIAFNMTDEGAGLMGGLTGEFMPDKETGFAHKLGILLDNELLSAPAIRGNITDSGRITGSFTQSEVDFLVNVLEAGQLPARLEKEPLSRDIIDSQLGRDMVSKGVYSIGGSLLVVLLFMLVYYRFAGILACAALMLNLLLIVAAMILVKAPFTLPGLAGIVLTVGMAVDANVLIYERMREEMARGAAMRMVIRNGFDRATTTIIDSNLTTVITAVVLYVVGTDQLRGFAVALVLGLVISMFTAIFCSRVMFDIAERKWGLNRLKMMQLVGHTNIDFMKLRWPTAAVSLVIIAIGLVATVIRGREILDIDLQGGASVGLVLNDASMGTEDVRRLLNEELKEKRKVDFTLAKVQTGGAETQPVWNLDTSYASAEELAQAMKEIFGDKLAMHSLSYAPPKPVEAASGAATGGSSPDAADGASLVPGDSRLDFHRGEGLFFVAQVEENPPADSPAEETPAEETPAEETPAAESPAAETPAAETPAAEPSAEETPAAETPSADTPPAETPDEGAAPAEGATTEGTPTEGAAADQPGDAARPAPVVRPRFETTLTLSHPTDQQSLLAAIEQSIDEQKLQISESDIQLTAPDAESTDNPRATKWRLVVTGKQADVDALLKDLETHFDGEPYFRGLRVVKGQVAGDKRTMAAWALIASFVGIVAYIWVRFQKVSFGLAAVVALVHDVLVTLAAIAVSYWAASALGFLMVDQFKISLAVVAAFLTIIGYSLNDTIVIFDRIREIRGKSPEINSTMVNAAVNQTLSRSILTSLTVLMVVVILYIFGGQAIHPFAFAMVVGVIAGSYSTIFIASPVLLWLTNYAKSHSRAQDRTSGRMTTKEGKSLTT